MHGIERPIGVDGADAIRLGLRKSGITGLNSLKKLTICGLKAIRAPSIGTAFFTGFNGDLQQNRQIRPCFTHGKVDDRLHSRCIQPAPRALINCGGIIKAIAQNHLARGQSGPDDLPHKLRAAGVHQQKLGLGGEIFWAVLEQLANLFATLRAARLAHHAHGVSLRLQAFGELVDVR